MKLYNVTIKQVVEIKGTIMANSMDSAEDTIANAQLGMAYEDILNTVDRVEFERPTIEEIDYV